MLSIVIPTLNAANNLPATLECIVRGLVKFEQSQIIISDGGSTDSTLQNAQEAGAEVVSGPKGRGHQLMAGADAANSDWLLFIHADTVLQSSWPDVVTKFIADSSTKPTQDTAAVFRFQLDDNSPEARRLEAIVAWRTKWLALPYGDQGLLISRKHYESVGGFRPISIMEDVDIIRRIGRNNFTVLNCDAVTSASRYKRDGYLHRVLRNFGCLSMWFLGISPDTIAKVYR